MAIQCYKSALSLAILACFSHQVVAADIINESSFKSSSTIEVSSPIDSVLLYKKNANKDDNLTINVANGGDLHFNPSQNRGIIVNRPKNSLSLTINSNLSFGSKENQLVLKPQKIEKEGLYDTSLIQVGNGWRKDYSGHLEINGNLNIQNIDFSQVKYLIDVTGDGNQKRSSFSVKDVTISDVNGGLSKGLINVRDADVTFGKITLNNVTASSALNFNNLSKSTIGSLAINGGEFNSYAVRIPYANILGDMTVTGTADKKVSFTDKLIYLDYDAKVGGDISVQHVAGGHNVVSVNRNGNENNRFKFNNIEVRDSELKGTSFYQDAVINFEQADYELKSALVENASFANDSINEISGIRLSSAHTEKPVNSLVVKNLTVAATQDNGSNVDGIRFETSSAAQGIENVIIDGVHATGTYARGLSVENPRSEKDKNFEQHFGAVIVNDISSKAKHAYGIHAVTNRTNPQAVVFDKTVSITNIVTEGNGFAAYGIRAQDLKFNGGLTIKDLKGDYRYAIRAGKALAGGININATEGAVNQIEGDIFADEAGIVNASFGNRESYVLGRIYAFDGGAINANFDNGAHWNVTKNSVLTNLHIGQSSFVDLTYQVDAQNQKTHTVTSNRFDSKGGQLVMRIDPTVQADTTKLIVNGEAAGNFTAVLDVVNGDQITADNPKSQSWVISQKTGTLKVDKVSYKDGAAKAFDLKFFEDNAQDAQGLSSSTGNSGKWHLVAGTSEPENPDKPPVTPEVDQVLSLGASVAQGLGMLSETEDLRMRMGDIRNGITDGAWARTYARRDTAHGSYGNGFEQDTYGIHVGADRVVTAGNNASWLLGGAFHYGKSDMDGVADTSGGSADVDQYSFKAYATYMHDNGIFADIVLHAGYYENDLTGKTNTGLGHFTAEYNNWGYGVSAEVGRRINLGEGSGWYAEPTAQLTWFHVDGQDFKTSTGLEITQSDADFITGRAGLALGKTFALGTQAEPMSSYVSVALKGGMLYQFDGDQTITARGTDKSTVQVSDAMNMDGLRGYYGLTADWQINDAWRLYGQLSREQGSGYTKDFDASFGVQYRW